MRRWRDGRIPILLLVAMAVPAIGHAAGAVTLAAEEGAPPVIVTVAAPPRLGVGMPGEVGLVYRAAQANVVAVLQTIEDMDGPPAQRATRQRAINVIARAFGRETGELRIPLAFQTPGRKRVTFVLVTDEREESEPVEIEVDATP